MAGVHWKRPFGEGGPNGRSGSDRVSLVRHHNAEKRPVELGVPEADFRQRLLPTDRHRSIRLKRSSAIGAVIRRIAAFGAGADTENNRIELSYSPVIQPRRETTAEKTVKSQRQRRHSGITGNGYE